jgi:PleD family two-component response regulator
MEVGYNRSYSRVSWCSPLPKGQMSVIRILVVDDHAAVRRAICSLLSSDPALDVVCQTTDGEQAVLKAEELQPDQPARDQRH